MFMFCYVYAQLCFSFCYVYVLSCLCFVMFVLWYVYVLLSLCFVTYMLWYDYVLLCLCLTMFMLCYVSVFSCWCSVMFMFVVFMFCYGLFWRVGKEWRICYKLTFSISYKPTLSIIMFMLCNVYALMCLCIVIFMFCYVYALICFCLVMFMFCYVFVFSCLRYVMFMFVVFLFCYSFFWRRVSAESSAPQLFSRENCNRWRIVGSLETGNGILAYVRFRVPEKRRNTKPETFENRVPTFQETMEMWDRKHKGSCDFWVPRRAAEVQNDTLFGECWLIAYSLYLYPSPEETITK